MNNEMKEKLVAEYIAEVQPHDAQSHVLAFAHCKVYFEASQALYSKHAGFSDRGLREHISKNRELFDEEVSRLEEDKEQPLDITGINTRGLTEEQLDKFVDVLFQQAIKGNARDRELYIKFTGITAEDVMNLNEVKEKSLRHWIKGKLSTIKQYMNTKTLGIMTETSKYIYRGDRKSMHNSQHYVDAKLTDDVFKKELMYWGAVHLNMMNNVEHPETELLATAVRVDRLSAGFIEEYDKNAVRQYAKGKNVNEKSSLSDKSMEELFQELETLTEGIVNQERVDAIVSARRFSEDNIKIPDIDKPEVKQRASEYEDELTVLLTAEEELKHMLRKIETN